MKSDNTSYPDVLCGRRILRNQERRRRVLVLIAASPMKAGESNYAHCICIQVAQKGADIPVLTTKGSQLPKRTPPLSSMFTCKTGLGETFLEGIKTLLRAVQIAGRETNHIRLAMIGRGRGSAAQGIDQRAQFILKYPAFDHGFSHPCGVLKPHNRYSVRL